MRHDTIWQTAVTTNTYLNGLRGAIPLAHEQCDAADDGVIVVLG